MTEDVLILEGNLHYYGGVGIFGVLIRGCILLVFCMGCPIVFERGTVMVVSIGVLYLSFC